MPHDSISSPSRDRPSGRSRFVRPITLTILVLLTSWAVGVTTSFWFVPLYLAAMGWLLTGSSPRPTVEASPLDVVTVVEPSSPTSPSAITPELDLEKTPKSGGKRGRTRKPKAKPKAEEPVNSTVATWVQVAPGKFVRVELPATEPDSEAALAPENDPEATEPAATPVSVEVTDSPPATIDPETSDDAPPEQKEFAASHDAIAIIEIESRRASCEPNEPPRDPRSVTVEDRQKFRRVRVSFDRSYRLRRDPRPKVRRGNGRVGAMPRVVLHRD